jgi:hypothetical protein
VALQAARRDYGARSAKGQDAEEEEVGRRGDSDAVTPRRWLAQGLAAGRGHPAQDSASTPNGVKHEHDDDGNESDSDLSSAPSEDDLLALLNPEGYAASADAVKEQGAALVQRVDEWPSGSPSLEWKGLGEI